MTSVGRWGAPRRPSAGRAGRHDRAPKRVSVGRLVGRFSLAGLVALMAVAVAAAWVSRRVGTNQAMTTAKRDAWLSGKGVVEPAITPGVLRGERPALDALDAQVRRSVLQGSLMRVKVWRADGTVVYSDDQRLVGESFELDGDELDLLEGGGPPVAGVSDLDKPENRYEDGSTKLLEVYLPIVGPDGRPLLFEAYFRYDGVIDAGRSVWLSFAPVALGGLVLLQAVQVPFAWSLARRLRRNQDQRERLLENAIESSENERRRIARDLHDGVVQDLTGVSYLLAARSRAGSVPDPHLEGAAERIRDSVKALRSMLVDIYPPNLAEAGLAAALGDLLASLVNRGVTVQLDVDIDDERRLDGVAPLLYRAAQEAVRNVMAHADATTVAVTASLDTHAARLRVEDDGRGFDPASAGAVSVDGHVGLRVLADLIAEAGGTMSLASAPGRGTEIEVEIPLP